MNSISLKKDMKKLGVKTPKEFYGFLCEEYISSIFKKYKPVKIAERNKKNVFEVNVKDIADRILKGRLSKEERKEREKLLFYLRKTKIGLPDFIAVVKKVIFFIEIKYGKGELEPKQKEVRKILEKKMNYPFLTIKYKRGKFFFLEKDLWELVGTQKQVKIK